MPAWTIRGTCPSGHRAADPSDAGGAEAAGRSGYFLKTLATKEVGEILAYSTAPDRTLPFRHLKRGDWRIPPQV